MSCGDTFPFAVFRTGVPAVGVSDTDGGGGESSRNGVADDDDAEATTSGEGLLDRSSSDMVETSSSLMCGGLAISSPWWLSALQPNSRSRVVHLVPT